MHIDTPTATAGTATDITAALAARVRQAASSGTALRIRGGGTKDFYGQALAGEVLDLSAHSGVISYEPSELVVTVRGGTPLAELEALLAERHQCLPFEPPHFGPGATVGGMVASGLNGPARASVGAVRDYLLGCVLLNGKGEILTFGGQVMKNVAGYDVPRLMAGALGTLGVLLEVSLKVLPVMPAEATLTCGLPQQTALNLLHRWGGQPLPLNASCWVHDGTSTPPQDFLFVRLRGAVAAVEAACPRMMADVDAAGGQAARMDNAQAGADWRACGEQTLPFFTQPPSERDCLWRLSLPQTTPALDLPYPQLIEWHGGLRWLWAPASSAGQLRQAAAKAGGHATLFRRGQEAPPDLPVFTPLPPVQARIQGELKKQFDPAGVFNPGRLFAGW
ncbi:MAG: linked oxidase domain protein [Polaromonas sp.]|nr:linked oxidase domain protein [Polaromonas sp.]